MNENTKNYINLLEMSVIEKISDEINESRLNQIIHDNIYLAHIKDFRSSKFQNFYFKSINNEEYYYSTNNYFAQFKQQYSLQGIDNKFLQRLESNKEVILSYIRLNKLMELYTEFFKKASIKHGDIQIEKDLGSFFTKLVHTFNPSKYCALDNPIRNYFGLSKESFFVSFLILSGAYINWATENQALISRIKKEIKTFDKQEILKLDQLTEIKLLDLIFWSKADWEKKNKPAGNTG